MKAEALEQYMLSKEKAFMDYPFDDVTPVLKVGKKMFALIGSIGGLSVSLKCDPDDAIYLRDMHPAIIPGYHLSKKHWNTVILDGSLEDELIKSLIDHSYDLVVKSMPKGERLELFGSLL
ncbi:MAG: MmcQ/YjbR family DNA-binding protein [Vallitaleaceae bacterium]|jgi:predicted DNA-binding protein (MmcQ/YjbR family)|nr:MmcQ/YjbR family DNA-binding protein [Vallitaleaceae bacterium]